MAQIIYIPQPSADDTSYAPPQQQQAPAPQAQGGGVGLMGLLGAGLAGAGVAKYGPKMFARGAPAPAAAAQAAPTIAPAPAAPTAAPAASPQPAAPAEPPVDLTKALDPKVPPPPPKTGFAGGQPTDVGSGQSFGTRDAVRARQAAQDATQAAAMESEGGGSVLSRFLGNVAGSAPVQVASKFGKLAGYAGMMENAVHQNAIIPEFKHLFMGGPDAGPQAVADAGPLTSSVEPATARMMAATNNSTPVVRGAARIGGLVANSAARAADITGFPAGISAIGKYLGSGFGGQLDIPTSLGYIGKALGGGGAQAAPAAPSPAAPAQQPITMQQNKDGTHTVTVNGVSHHPTTHTVDDFVNNARASGVTLNDLNKMYALHQHFNPQQNAAAMALANAQQAHDRQQTSDAEFNKTLERWGLLGGAALYPDNSGAQ